MRANSPELADSAHLQRYGCVESATSRCEEVLLIRQSLPHLCSSLFRPACRARNAVGPGFDESDG